MVQAIPYITTDFHRLQEYVILSAVSFLALPCKVLIESRVTSTAVYTILDVGLGAPKSVKSERTCLLTWGPNSIGWYGSAYVLSK